MKYCTNCGHEMHDEAIVCVNCGVSVKKPSKKAKPIDSPHGGFTALGIFVPQVALIFYIIFKCKGMPLRAHSAGKGALIGAIIMSVSYTFYYLYYYIYLFLGLSSLI